MARTIDKKIAVSKCRQFNTRIGEGEREEKKVFSLYLFPLSLPFISLTWWKQEGQLVFDVCPYAKTKTRLSTAITLLCQLIMLGTGFIRSIGILCLRFRNIWRSEKYRNLSYNETAFSEHFFSIAIASIYLRNSAFRFRCKYLKLLAWVKLIIGDRRRFSLKRTQSLRI